MERKTQLMFGIGLGLAAVVLLQLYIKGIKQELYEGYETREVLVARADILKGSEVKEEAIGIEGVPEKFVHPQTLMPNDRDIVLGQRAALNIKRGQPFLWSDIGVEESGASGLAGIIRENERAISVPVDEVTSVSGLVKPGDHVDILGTFLLQDSSGSRSTTLTLLQNVVVLAVGTHYGSGANSPREFNTVTFSVSPSEAELLTLAQEKGKLTLVLRNPQNLKTEENLPKTTMDDILRTNRIEQIQKERNIRVIKGKE